MQKKRNIKLFIILIATVVLVAAAFWITRPADRLNVDRGVFTYDNPSEISKVVFSDNNKEIELIYQGRQWQVNKEYSADPQRVSVLFAILKQMRVRRKVSNQQEDFIAEKMGQGGTQVTLYQDDQPVHSFYVWGDDESGMTYVAEKPDQQAYLVEIPGYRSYLAGIYQLDENGWRDPLAFNLNWSNLSNVKVIYPREPERGFSVTYDNRFFSIPEINKTDSVKLTDFLDNVSLLYVNSYLNERERQQYTDMIDAGAQASFQVQDVGKNTYTLEIYETLPGGKEILGRIDSLDYAKFDVNKVRKAMRPRSFFIKE